MADDVRVFLDTDRPEDYRTFLRLKRLPRVRFQGRTAIVPAEYAESLGLPPAAEHGGFDPAPFLFDYQRDIVRMAVRKRRFAVFADCGLGKSLILLEFARHCASALPTGRAVLICSPLMVCRQTAAEARRFYGDSLPVEQVAARDLSAWLASGREAVGITNYEAITDDLAPGRLGALVLDESSMLKSHYGKWGQRLIELGRGLEWKLCLTGTPAPNDRIEYANHAVFLGREPTVNAFLARYFVNRGQTDNRWELKPHALGPFYRSLSDWCIFLTDPATYGWRDNVASGLPPISVHVHDVPLTGEQVALSVRAGGDMFGTPGGITSRAKLSQLAKGRHDGAKVATNKPAFIRDLVGSWPEESTIVWTVYNDEQDTIEGAIPGSVGIRGDTPYEERARIVEDFQAGRTKVLVTKAKVLGYGLNLQIATRQVFSGLVDSYESYYQAVKRSNRIGSTLPLNVHIPVTPIERPMIETVLAKAKRVQCDAEEQERIFKGVRHG